MLINPLPGVAGRTLLASLVEAATAVSNVRGAGGTALERFNAYLSWSNNEARRLGHVVSNETLNRLVTTPRYWTLQTIDPAAHGALHTLVDVELEERVRDLEAARDALQSELGRWEARPGAIVVADTNVYLHHVAYFDEIAWHQVLPITHEGLVLVIPLIVMDEFDKSKMSTRYVRGKDGEKVRTRARVTLQRLNAMFTDVSMRAQIQQGHGPGLPAVHARLLLDEPGHVRLHEPDDEFVGRAASLQDVVGRQVRLVSFDTGVALRARAAGLQDVLLEDEIVA